MTSLLDAPLRQAASLEQLEHRPWPIPDRPWTMGQTWEELLFAHWRVPAAALEPRLPEGLELDTFEGDAWLGLTPFRLTGLRPRGLPPLPWGSSFLELNVRTYATTGGKPGIWFFSLDASSTVAVELARRTYKLPYFRARMSAARRGEWIAYECARADEPGRAFSGRYRATGPERQRAKGSLEHFLTERYCLYTTDERGRLLRANIHHVPWPLRDAELDLELNTMAPVTLPDEAPLCHYAHRLDVVVWPLERVVV
jgi:uncharacterized protein